MVSPTPPANDLTARLSRIVDEYGGSADLATLRLRLRELVESATPDALVAAAEPHRGEPEVMAAVYEAVVAAQPENARALVILANAWWLQGRGPDAVGDLASRALAIDPANRGAWHLWALAESHPRDRLARWQQVAQRFPDDHLAMAAVADGAASLAGAERDYAMLDLAVDTYERLLERSTEPAQREAVSHALTALRGWRF